MHKIFILLTISLFMFLFSSASYAEDIQTDSAKEYWDAIAKRPDATITITKDPTTGAEVKTAKFKGGVEISSDGSSTLGVDNSGLGAVLCVRELTIPMPVILRKCGSDKYAEDIKKLDDIVQKMDDFLVKNSILPINPTDVDANTRKIRENAELRPECEGEFSKHILENWSKDETKKAVFYTDLEKMLSVPRPPVRNPCL